MIDESFTFLHCADLHLDSPFRGIEGSEPRIARRLQRAAFEAWEGLIEAAVREKVDFVVIAGDAYDGESRNLWAQLRFRASLERLAAAGIACFLAHGNHDPATSWNGDLSLPPSVHRFSDEQPEILEFRRQGKLVARVCGMSYGQRQEPRDLAQLFPRPPDDVPAIAVLHANVGAQGGYENYAPTRIEVLRAAGYTYWALGHVHRRQILRAGHPMVVYAGFLQGRSVRETGAGGAYRVQVSPAGDCAARFLPGDVVRWSEAEIDVTLCPSSEALLNELLRCRDQARPRRTEADSCQAALLRLRLIGRSPLHGRLQSLLHQEALLEALREAEAEREDFVWIDALEVATTSVVDREALAGQASLAGEVVRQAQVLAGEKPLAAAIRELLSGLPETARIRSLVEAWSDGDLEALFEEATSEVLDLLLEGGPG
jgi:DNA repair exonuclease SbcCD nuclease subunit